MRSHVDYTKKINGKVRQCETGFTAIFYLFFIGTVGPFYGHPVFVTPALRMNGREEVGVSLPGDLTIMLVPGGHLPLFGRNASD